MSLVLPAPVNTHEHADALPAGPSPAGEEVDDSSLPESERLKKKLIYPPPEIRSQSHTSVPSCLLSVPPN